MLLAGLTLLPALLAIFGRAAFWPSKTREGTGKVGVWGRVATRIVQHPAGYSLTPAQYAALHARLGPAKLSPPVPPAGLKIPAAGYQLYRATAQYVSPDGRTVQFATGLKAGDAASTSALDAVPSIRDEATRVARNIGAIDSGEGGGAGRGQLGQRRLAGHRVRG